MIVELTHVKPVHSDGFRDCMVAAMAGAAARLLVIVPGTLAAGGVWVDRRSPGWSKHPDPPAIWIGFTTAMLTARF